jgi:LuxR family maltose regulon positive regulatory protein
MAEPTAAAPQAAAPGGDGLLATKLYLPSPRPGLVPRPRLAGQLEAGLGQGMVLVSAPAGYGKTVLLADWARAAQRPVAWLSLDPGDNDPARFWRHAVAALDRVRPGVGARVGPLIGPPTPASFEGLLTALINDLDAGPSDEPVLVLDDYHVIAARPVHDSVQFLLEHWPPGLGLVLSSRPGDAGLDPAGPGESGPGAGSDAGSCADLAGAGRAAQPSPGPAGQAAAGPGRPARRRPLDS